MRHLPPFSASLAFKIKHFLEDRLNIHTPWPLCVAAVSGGADSTALLLLLSALEIPLTVVHLDHSLRKESAAEANAVKELAASLGLDFVSRRVDTAAFAQKEKIGLEEAGRKLRYALFEQVRLKQGASWILTAHHLDDLCEDVLLRLIRGSGWPALGGMKARDNTRHILRPLLHIRRHELEKSLLELGQTWHTDESNLQRISRRNRIRLDILPLIEAENPAFADGVRRLWLLAREDEYYWQKEIDKALKKAPQSPAKTKKTAQSAIFLPQECLQNLPRATRMRLYLACIHKARAKGQAKMKALLRLDELWLKRQSGSIIQMPGFEAKIEPEGISFLPHKPAQILS